ncbi:DUF6265 family protein [Nannocystaceae bacterium ST9]
MDHRAPFGLVGLVLATLACTPKPTTSSPEPEPESAPDDRVARLCGTWRAEGPDGSIIEERWRPSDQGLVGEGTTTDAQGNVVSRESLVLLLRPGGSTYRAHPQGAAAPTDFEQSSDFPKRAPGQWVWSWSNPTHDFPRHIDYSSNLDGSLSATIWADDPESAIGWTFTRVAACSE